MKTRPSTFTLCCPRPDGRELYATRFLHCRRRGSRLDRPDADSPAHCACPAVPDRVLVGCRRGVLSARRLICGSARSHCLRRRDHGAFCFRGDDAQPGRTGGRNGRTLANPRDLGWSGGSGRHPYYRGPLYGPRQHGRLRGWRGGTQASWDRTVWTLPDWRGTCFHAPAGGTCWRVSPELPQSRKTGDST